MNLVMPEPQVQAVLPSEDSFWRRIPQIRQLFLGLIYTQSGSCDSLDLQLAVPPAAQGLRVLLILGEER